MRLQITHRLLALGLGGVLSTAVVLVGVGAWQSSRSADSTEAEVVRQNTESLDRATGDITTLVSSVADEVQDAVNADMKAADVLLDQRGGARLSGRTATWTATNQTTQAKKTVTLPG